MNNTEKHKQRKTVFIYYKKKNYITMNAALINKARTG